MVQLLRGKPRIPRIVMVDEIDAYPVAMFRLDRPGPNRRPPVPAPRSPAAPPPPGGALGPS